VCSGLSESRPVSVTVIEPVPVIITVKTAVVFLLTDADITKAVNTDHYILTAGLKEGLADQPFSSSKVTSAHFINFDAVLVSVEFRKTDGDVVAKVAFTINDYFEIVVAVDGDHRPSVSGHQGNGKE